MSKARDLADSAQEINILDGKSFLDEDNLASDSATGIASQQSIKAYVDGITTTNITSTGALNSGSITSGFGNINNGSSTITTTGAISGGSFVIGSADINENDLESIDGITAGTVAASKAVVVNANKDITGFRNLTATGTISGTLSGAIASTTTATTQAESDDSTKVATTAYVVDKITTLIGGAPSTLNDLNELAAAINDDANYNSTLTTALATKLPLAGGTMTGDVLYNDNVKAKFGAGSDLEIYHNNSDNNSYITETGSGSLVIAADQLYIQNAAKTETKAIFTTDGGVLLRHNDVAKFETTSTGITVTGDISNAGGSMTMNSAANLTLDVAGDITLDSDSGYVWFNDGGTTIGYLKNESTDLSINVHNQSRDMLFKGNDDGSTITALTLDMSDAGTAIFNHDIKLGDSGKVIFGASNDLQIYHDGSNSYVNDTGTGDLVLKTNGAGVQMWGGGDVMLNAVKDGAVSLYYDNSAKLATTSTGIAVTGSTAHTAGNITNTISGTYNLNGANGTAGSPAYATYSFKDDPNTGMYRASADNLAFTTAGSERLRLTSNGRQAYNGSATALGHANFVGEVGSSYKALAFEHTVGGGEVGSIRTTSSTAVYYGDGSNLTGVGGSTTSGAVGTYAWLGAHASGVYAIYAGTNYSGSDYRYAGVHQYYWNVGYGARSVNRGATPAGTWRAMGTAIGAGSWGYPSTIFVRIS